MSSLSDSHHIVPLYARASRWRDGDPYEVALVGGHPHRRARGPDWLDRMFARGDRLLGHSAHHHRALAQVTLLLGVVAWWFPGVIALAVLAPVLACWGYVVLERAARRWVRWVPVPWDDEVRRYAARASAADDRSPESVTRDGAGSSASSTGPARQPRRYAVE